MSDCSWLSFIACRTRVRELWKMFLSWLLSRTLWPPGPHPSEQKCVQHNVYQTFYWTYFKMMLKHSSSSPDRTWGAVVKKDEGKRQNVSSVLCGTDPIGRNERKCVPALDELLKLWKKQRVKQWQQYEEWKHCCEYLSRRLLLQVGNVSPEVCCICLSFPVLKITPKKQRFWTTSCYDKTIARW